LCVHHSTCPRSHRVDALLTLALCTPALCTPAWSTPSLHRIALAHLRPTPPPHEPLSTRRRRWTHRVLLITRVKPCRREHGVLLRAPSACPQIAHTPMHARPACLSGCLAARAMECCSKQTDQRPDRGSAWRSSVSCTPMRLQLDRTHAHAHAWLLGCLAACPCMLHEQTD
jgi:hypothetical protein